MLRAEVVSIYGSSVHLHIRAFPQPRFRNSIHHVRPINVIYELAWTLGRIASRGRGERCGKLYCSGSYVLFWFPYGQGLKHQGVYARLPRDIMVAIGIWAVVRGGFEVARGLLWFTFLLFKYFFSWWFMFVLSVIVLLDDLSRRLCSRHLHLDLSIYLLSIYLSIYYV